MKKSIFNDNQKYTFSDYFNMPYSTEEIVAALGYRFSTDVIELPKYTDFDPAIIERLNALYYAIIPKINLNSELAKREFLIAPLLIELTRHADMKIDVEYPLYCNEKLSGSLDYLLTSRQDLIVIEAKKKDLDSGFNQLAAELIALDFYEDNQKIEVIYGAVTLGDVWKFATLNRKTKQLIKNIDSHVIPSHTDEVFTILMGIMRL
jgi:hypothetical protein